MKMFIHKGNINMNGSITILREEVATGPMEPYVLDREGINLN